MDYKIELSCWSMGSSIQTHVSQWPSSVTLSGCPFSTIQVIVIAVSSALQSMGFGAKNDIKSVGHGGNRDEEIVSHCNRSIGQEPSGNTVPAVDLS